MTDYRFPAPGTDARFPSPGTDAYFPSPGVNARFVGGVDLRFTAPGFGVASNVINLVAPAITGAGVAGETLSCDPGIWNSTDGPIVGYTYQWRRNGSAISGATSQTYRLVTADDGANITCAVVATDLIGGTGLAISAALGPIVAVALGGLLLVNGVSRLLLRA